MAGQHTQSAGLSLIVGINFFTAAMMTASALPLRICLLLLLLLQCAAG
jgi:hypothetical protein